MTWIPTADRMPDEGVPVLLYCGVCLLGEWYSFSDSWQADDRRIPEESVTHWMPLPEPPKEPA